MSQQRDKFRRREIEWSFRKFRDLVDDLMAAKFQTWDDDFVRLITHCETDPVMQVITEPLATYPRIDADKWWSDAVNSVGGVAGSGQYTLPADADQRTALLYQVFLKPKREEVNFACFCVAVYGHTDYQKMVDTFNRELVYPFSREVSNRLDEILATNADQEEIARQSLLVFHHDNDSPTGSDTK